MSHISYSKHIHQLAEILSEKGINDDRPGLVEGTLGKAIFFYHWSKYCDSTRFHNIADELLDKIYNRLNSDVSNLSFSNGLTGIAIGLDHLMKMDFIEGEKDEVFQDIDVRLYTTIFGQETLAELGLNDQLYFFLYLLRQIEKKSGALQARQYLLRSACIELINALNKAINNQMEELSCPSKFTLFWPLPCLLYCLGLASAKQIYCSKIKTVIDDLTDLVASMIPVSHGNRLYLLNALLFLSQNHVLPKIWYSHIELLYKNIDLSYLLQSELKDGRIGLIDGKSGIIVLSCFHNEICEGKNKFDINLIINSVLSSQRWNELSEDGFGFNYSLGFGMSGIGLALIQGLRSSGNSN